MNPQSPPVRALSQEGRGGRLLTAREVAEDLALSTETILSWVRSGKLPAFRLPSGQIRFREEALAEWLEQRAVGVKESRLTIIRGEG